MMMMMMIVDKRISLLEFSLRERGAALVSEYS